MKTGVLIHLVAGMLLGSVAHAQATGHSGVVELQQYRIREVTQPDGKVLELSELSPKTLMPGDVLEERITVKNSTNQPLRLAGLRFPVAQGLTFLTVGKSGYQVEYSIDGGKTFSFRPVIVKVVDGVRKDVSAAPETYNSLRWDIHSLAPGAQKVFTARFKVKQ